MSDVIPEIRKTIRTLLDQKLCSPVRAKLEDYLTFLARPPASLRGIQKQMLSVIGKAVHIDNFPTADYFYYTLESFFKSLLSYVVAYNAIARKRKRDTEAYFNFCNNVFAQQTPCFELTSEILAELAPVEATVTATIEEKLDLSHPAVIKITERAKAGLHRVKTLDAFYAKLTRAFQLALCTALDVGCGEGTIRDYYTSDNMLNYLYSFGLVEEFSELEDVFTVDDLVAALESFDISFEAGIDYLPRKVCC